MRDSLPPEVVAISTTSGARYVLPPPPGVPRAVGPFLIGFGLIPLCMGTAFIVLVLNVVTAPFPFTLIIVPLLVVPAGFVLVGLALMFLGGFFVIGRHEIELTGETLSSAMCVGPFRWRGRRRRDQVQGLTAESSSRDDHSTSHHQLTAVCHGARPLSLAFGQPLELLEAVGGHLCQRWAETGEGRPLTLQVIEQAGAGSSAAWRRTIRRRKVAGRVFFCCFYGIFFFAGCVAFYFIVTALLAGDPGNNLQGAFPGKYLWALFPLPFLAVGGGGILYQLFQRPQEGLSPEQLALGKSSSRETDQPTASLPNVPEIHTTSGSELEHQVALGDSPIVAVVFLSVVLLVCSGVLTPLVWNVVQAFKAGKLQEAATCSGVFALFLGLIWMTIAWNIVSNLRQWRLGQPVVEIDRHPLHPGDTVEILLRLPLTRPLRSLSVAFLCEEEARYRQGTDTRTETRCVHREELLGGPGHPQRIRIPPGAMHSFESANNKVRWLVRVKGQAEGILGLELQHEYPLAVHPPREGEARE